MLKSRLSKQSSSGEAKLGEKKVDIIPPAPIGELGSGYEKIAGEKRGTKLTVVR